jgi:hypothetical protein
MLTPVELWHLSNLLLRHLRHCGVPRVRAPLDKRDEGITLGIVEQHHEVIFRALLDARQGRHHRQIGLVALVPSAVFGFTNGLRHINCDMVLRDREHILLLLQHHLLVPDPRQQVLVARPHRDLAESRRVPVADATLGPFIRHLCGVVYIQHVFDVGR